eukprot:g29756.t1
MILTHSCRSFPEISVVASTNSTCTKVDQALLYNSSVSSASASLEDYRGWNESPPPKVYKSEDDTFRALNLKGLLLGLQHAVVILVALIKPAQHRVQGPPAH